MPDLVQQLGLKKVKAPMLFPLARWRAERILGREIENGLRIEILADQRIEIDVGASTIELPRVNILEFVVNGSLYHAEVEPRGRNLNQVPVGAVNMVFRAGITALMFWPLKTVIVTAIQPQPSDANERPIYISYQQETAHAHSFDEFSRV